MGEPCFLFYNNLLGVSGLLVKMALLRREFL
jgi:hypothetical protein